MNSGTSLGFVMDLMNVSGKELAYDLGRDPSIVSKWRNNKRKLSHRSQITVEIAEYFFSDRFRIMRDELIKLLRNEYGELCCETKDGRISSLCRYLSEDHQQIIDISYDKKTSYDISVKIFNGIHKGWMRAMDEFFDIAVNNTDKDKVYICDFGDIVWELAENSMYHSRIKKHLVEMAELGYEVHIIDLAGNNYKSHEVLLRNLDTYMCENIHTYYLEERYQGISRESLYVISGKSAFKGQAISDDSNENRYELYIDYGSIHFYEKRVKHIMENSKLMINKIKVKNYDALVKMLDENLLEHRSTYMINQSPTFNNMPESLLRDILECNDVDERLIEKCIEIVEKRKEIRQRCDYKQIYNLDAIEEILSKESFRDELLSYITGKDIYITKKQFIEQLKFIYLQFREGYYNLVMASFDYAKVDVKEVSIIVQEGRIAVVWDTSRYSRMIYSKELTYVGGYFKFLKETWDNIPQLYKNKEWLEQQFVHLIGEAL